MIQRGQWLVLPAKAVLHLPGLRVSPPGVVPQRERRPRWICDYSWWGVNQDTLPLAAMEAMQFGHALDRILREILLADPAFGPVHLLKVDLSDGFYRLDVNVDDIPKLGVVFPTAPGEEQLIAFPLVLPMGWTNSPPIFSTATETIADVANDRLASYPHSAPHHLDELAGSVTPPMPVTPSVPCIPRDPSLPLCGTPLSYVDVFVDDFIGAAQNSRTPSSSNLTRVRRTLLHAIDDVFRPLSPNDSPHRQEPVSMKKLLQGDCSWSTCKTVLGWVINTVSQTLTLPPPRVDALADILASIPLSQRRTSTTKWHSILGQLRSMSLALPGSRNVFSALQLALASRHKGRIALNKGVHHALEDFRWMLDSIASRPTRISELIPLAPSAEGHHDASGLGAGGIWFPSSSVTPRSGFTAQPLVWRFQWPSYVTDLLVTDNNPSGTITNSDLELAGGLMHLEAITQAFDIRERTVLSKGDNLATTFWQRRGSTTSDKPPAYLLRLFGMHQRFHRYVPRFDYISGPSNHIADSLSRNFHLTWPQLLSSFSTHLPQNHGFQHWMPPPNIASAVISALLRKQCNKESLLAEPSAPSPRGRNGSPSPLNWPSTPFCKPSQTKFLSYKSSHSEFTAANLQPEAVQFGLDRLKITYGSLRRRSCTWGPTTPA